jgi:hypothetical protein
MSDQTKIAGLVADRLGQQLANAQSVTERNEILKAAVNSDQAEHLKEIADTDRITDKVESVTSNDKFLDRVHLSDRALALHKAHEAGLEDAPERIHERSRTEDVPEPSYGSPGNME